MSESSRRLGKLLRADSQAGVLSNLLSVLTSEQGVFDRQYRLDRHSLRNVSHLELAKYRNSRRAGVIQW